MTRRTQGWTADVVVARNLDMLMLAMLCVGRGPVFVYECLDVHAPCWDGA